MKRNPEQSLADNAAYTIPKRQTKKPKKVIVNPLLSSVVHAE